MSGCLECVIANVQNTKAIGVCVVCNSLGCANHGGKSRNQPRFRCSACWVGAITRSAGGSPPSGGTGGGPTPGGPPPDDDGGGSGRGAAFRSSLDFETQLPVLAQASESRRRSIDTQSLRESIRKLFSLLSDDQQRDDFCDNAREQLREPVRDEVFRMWRASDEARRALDERGGVEGVAASEVDDITSRIRDWLDHGLEPWMRQIHPALDERVWVGDRDEVGGVIDVLLMADAVGVNAYTWNMSVEESPYRRLDVVARIPLGLLVLSQLYTETLSVPA